MIERVFMYAKICSIRFLFRTEMTIIKRDAVRSEFSICYDFYKYNFCAHIFGQMLQRFHVRFAWIYCSVIVVSVIVNILLYYPRDKKKGKMRYFI